MVLFVHSADFASLVFPKILADLWPIVSLGRCANKRRPVSLRLSRETRFAQLGNNFGTRCTISVLVIIQRVRA